MDGDDKMPRREALTARGRGALRVRVVAAVVVLALVAAGVVVAFHRSSHHLASLHHDAAASSDRVSTLTSQLATATSQRDLSLKEAAVARAALEAAHAAHLHSAAALRDERAGLLAAQRAAYISIVDTNSRATQLAALHTCLDGVSQALDMLGAGDVSGWQNRLQSIDAVCKQAQAAAA